MRIELSGEVQNRSCFEQAVAQVYRVKLRHDFLLLLVVYFPRERIEDSVSKNPSKPAVAQVKEWCGFDGELKRRSKIAGAMRLSSLPNNSTTIDPETLPVCRGFSLTEGFSSPGRKSPRIGYGKGVDTPRFATVALTLRARAQRVLWLLDSARASGPLQG